MDKNKYLEDLLHENIKTAKAFIKEHEKINDEVKDLPNDCTGIEIDGIVCENPNYKLDILTSNAHTIGYMTAVIKTSEEVLMINNFTNTQFEKYLKQQEEVKIHNEKIMKDLKGFEDL